jgi:TolB-like protein
MGEVYRARDERLSRDVAVKILPASSTDAESRMRFDREARAVASLSHPHIVPLFDVGEQDGIRFAVTELIEGETLRERLLRGPLPPAEAAELAAQVAEGLSSAHARGFVHRDVKPENIVITPDGRAKILDFGLVRSTAVEEGSKAQEADPTVTSLTEPGIVSGTVGYMSPEQVRGESVDGRSDIFALGTVLFEMLAGRRAFAASSKVETLNAILKEEPQPPDAPIPESLAAILARCLAKRRESRYHSAADLAHDLRSASAPKIATLSGAAVAAVPAPPRRKAANLAAAAAVFALAAVGIFLLTRRAGPGSHAPRTLAVLPFRAIGSESVPHFGLGLADSVIGRLASLRQLTVRPTSAITRFESAPADAREAGRQLDVEAVLEGTLQKLEGTTRVTYQLTDVSRGAILWSGSLDLPEGRLFEIQDAIAGGILDRLRVELEPSERHALQKAEPVPDEVIEEYFAARAELPEMIRMSPAGRTALVARLDRIIDRAPKFARAVAARSYARAVLNFQTPSSGGPDGILQDAERALALDPNLPEPRVARALVYWSSPGGWRWTDAVRELKSVIERNPGVEIAHLDLTRIFIHYGWFPEARAALEPARRLNPASPEVLRLWATILWYGGDLRAALDEYRRLPAEVTLGTTGGRWQILNLRLLLEDPRPLLTEAEAWVAEHPPATKLPQALLALARSRTGDSDIRELESDIASADTRVGHFHHVDHVMAEAHAQRGDSGHAVEYLRRAAGTGLACLPCFDTDPGLAPIRGSREYRSFREDLAKKDAEDRKALKDVF